MKKVLEICCGSYEDALCAYLAGANRIELNSALYLGGLTPSLGSLILAKKNMDIPIICMLRNRGAGFCYSPSEIDVIFEDAKILLEHGADGLCFGFLKEDFTIDVALSKKMISLIHSYHKEAVFHRAFDLTSDLNASLETLIDLKVDRVLTSGGLEKAPMASKKLKQLQETYGDQIELLMGSGISADNVKALMQETGIYQVHSSAKVWKEDPTTGNAYLGYGYHKEKDYDVVDKDKVIALKQEVEDVV